VGLAFVWLDMELWACDMVGGLASIKLKINWLIVESSGKIIIPTN
jgi:hypothetical protein